MSGPTDAILAVDPGLDALGWAAVRAVPPSPGVAFAAAYIGSGSIQTTPATGTEWQRYAYLLDKLVDVYLATARDALGVSWVRTVALICEIPRIDGTYTRNRGRTRDGFMPGAMKHVHRITGGLLAKFPPPIFRPMRATTTPKAQLHTLTQRALGDRWPTRSNEDQRDALALAYRFLTTTPPRGTP